MGDIQVCVLKHSASDYDGTTLKVKNCFDFVSDSSKASNDFSLGNYELQNEEYLLGRSHQPKSVIYF